MAAKDKTDIAKDAPAPDAPTPEKIAADALKAKQDKVFIALSSMDDAADSQWNADGSPSLEYLSGIVGEAITAEDVAAVVEEPADVMRKPVLKADKDPDDSDSQPEGKGPVKAPANVADLSTISPEQVQADLRRGLMLDEIIAAGQGHIRETNLEISKLQAERDAITRRQASQSGNSHSDAVKAVQARSFADNKQRADDVDAFRKMTGGVNVSQFATAADANRSQRRALRRRFAKQ